jgi:mono/diheme cytochrome c family protein
MLAGQGPAPGRLGKESRHMRNAFRIGSRASMAALVLALSALTSSAALAYDAARGGKLAKQWCASCHIVSSDQSSGSDSAPPFSSIANRADFAEKRTARFLTHSHPRMPGVHLSRDEARDLSAYIATLKH